MKLSKSILFSAAMLVLVVLISRPTYAGAWKVANTNGRYQVWYQEDDGTYPINTWKNIDSKWYHFDNNGYVSTGWLQDNGDWYYCYSSGKMAANGWINGKYYVGEDGKMYRNATTPDGKQVGEDGTLVNDSPIGGKWYLGIDADLTGIYETGEVSKPDNMNREYDNSWWYLYYAGNNANSTGYVYAQGWIWIDEDKNGIKDGILNRYYFDGGWLATNTIIDGKKVNGDGMWIVDNEVQTISQRRDVEGNTKWRGLTPGIYWDAKHNSRIEISKDWGLHYFENNKNTPYMEAEILYGEADESFPEMIYTVQVLKDPIKENNNKWKLNSNQNYLSIFIDAGEDYSGRGYSSPGDITIICGYTYGIFNQTDDKGRDRHFYFESK